MTNIFTKIFNWIANLFRSSEPTKTEEAQKLSYDEIDNSDLKPIFHIPELFNSDIKWIYYGDYKASISHFSLSQCYFYSLFIDHTKVFVDFWSLNSFEEKRFELSQKAIKELPSALIKAKNLYDRFSVSTLKRIILVPLSKDNTILDNSSDIVDSIGIAIEYELLDETRTFSAYYKNNEIKKKLKGAEITSTNVENAYKEAVASINQDWIDYGSDLRLIGNADPRLTKLNDNLIFVNSKIAEDGKYALMKAVSSAEFKHYMHLLLSHDIYSVSLAGYVQKRVAMDPELDPKGFIRFKPVFNHDSEILAVSAAVVKLNSRIAEDV